MLTSIWIYSIYPAICDIKIICIKRESTKKKTHIASVEWSYGHTKFNYIRVQTKLYGSGGKKNNIKEDRMEEENG